MTRAQTLEKKIARSATIVKWSFIGLMAVLAGEIGYLAYVCYILVKH
jgi:hypothetical protein